eukprot:gnl/Dysnectes_brevis/804_a886_3297.p1 GENE.gnl/Dysnectes_brevis/804_a886_3297~~gnl/Dysnectes_brevis/804_a886_3297.p1  ORF type:complete len:207 (+),score=37.54 gnl/Dysnectes_brevis/804_a886_3297:37-657(+)
MDGEPESQTEAITSTEVAAADSSSETERRLQIRVRRLRRGLRHMLKTKNLEDIHKNISTLLAQDDADSFHSSHLHSDMKHSDVIREEEESSEEESSFLPDEDLPRINPNTPQLSFEDFMKSMQMSLPTLDDEEEPEQWASTSASAVSPRSPEEDVETPQTPPKEEEEEKPLDLLPPPDDTLVDVDDIRRQMRMLEMGLSHTLEGDG